jgi:hypothetical protein
MEVVRGQERDCGQDVRGEVSSEKRERLDALARAGKGPAQLLTRARILLKAGASAFAAGDLS